MFGQGNIDYYLGKDMILSPNDERELESILSRLCNFEPIQYVQGTSRFLGRTFRVAPGVLIPRPETEELVERMLKEVAPVSRILDIGTGSGCIAVTLSKELPEAEVTAWDISGEALAIAGDNNHLLQASVLFVQRDVLTYQPVEGECFDVIVSNPPYVTETEKRDMEPNVLNWEPSRALFVPDSDPLRFYRRIGELGRSMLTAGGRLYFEINRAFGEAVASMLRKQGYTNVRIRKDISGNRPVRNCRTMIEITETEALNRVAAYCSTAEHCRAEIAEKLQRWGIAYDAIDRIINRLEQEKYIDEERFCRAFINDKYRFAKWGKMKIGQALQLKKISSSVYWPYLNEIDEEEYHAVLQKLLVAKRKSVRAESEYELNGKLVRFALSRGFEMKDICRCIEVSEENDYSE